jgi:PKD repeat protein
MELVFTTVNTAVANFEKTPAIGCGPLSVTLTNTSSILNSTIQYFWDFGNGTTSTNMHPGTIIFQNNPEYLDTTYHITLKAYNGCDTTYHFDSVTVYPNSKARFAVDTTRGCSPFTIHLTNTSAGNNSAYYWDFGDGQTLTTHTLGTLTHTYNTSVITTYILQLISENQCSRDTQQITLVVSPNSIQSFVTVNGDQLFGCAPHPVTFHNSSVGAAQLTWNFGDNSSPVITPNSQSNIHHTYATAGNFTVTIRLQNDCSDTTIYRHVIVYGAPVANFNIDPIKVCTGQSLAVHNTSLDANAFEWFWGDGTGTSAFEGSHAYSTPGIYEIMLVAKKVNPGGLVCTDTLRRLATVVDKLPAQINVAPGTHCAPYTLQVNAGNISGFSLIKWVVYDSSTSQGQFESTGLSTSHVYEVPGTYSVKLIVYTTLTGCADSVNYVFQVYNTPKTSFEPLLLTTCSHDTTISYTAVTTGTGGEAVNYSWFVNGSIEGSNNPFSYHFQTPLHNTSPVEYTIQALALNSAGCGDSSMASKLIVQPLPWPSIVVSPSLVIQQPDYEFTFEDTTVTNPNKTYVWYMGDASLQTRNGQKITYEYSDTGTYLVRCRVNDFATGCNASDSTKVTIEYIPGFLYVPNAMCMGCSNFGLRQFLPLGKGLKKYRLQIFNAWGQKIFETTSLDANGAPNQPWDGIFKNKPLQQDTYTWQIEASYKNDTEWKGMLFPGSNKPVKSGFITVIK